MILIAEIIELVEEAELCSFVRSTLRISIASYGLFTAKPNISNPQTILATVAGALIFIH